MSWTCPRKVEVDASHYLAPLGYEQVLKKVFLYTGHIYWWQFSEVKHIFTDKFCNFVLVAVLLFLTTHISSELNTWVSSHLILLETYELANIFNISPIYNRERFLEKLNKVHNFIPLGKGRAWVWMLEVAWWLNSTILSTRGVIHNIRAGTTHLRSLLVLTWGKNICLESNKMYTFFL